MASLADMSQVSQIEIRPAKGPVNADIQVPGSKSITNRALVMAALADGTSTLENALFSEDSEVCVDCLQKLGIAIETDPEQARIVVHGKGGDFPAKQAELFVGNSGTTARFVTAAATLGRGDYRFDGIARMRERPIGNLLKTLRELGAEVSSEGDRFPLTVHGHGLRGGAAEIDATESSQLLSAVLQVAPYAENDVTLSVAGSLVSLPYIDITIKMMEQFGVSVARGAGDASVVTDNATYRNYNIKSGQKYRAHRYEIEPDASNATYFFAAAAVTGGRVRVPYLTADSLQGDTHFVDILERMGCHVIRGETYIEVIGTPLRGIEEVLDMNAISDTVQTLAAIAPFADGPTEIHNIEHIRHKETDRIHAIVTELTKLGVKVEEYPDGLKIYPSALQPAAVDTYNDHRMAMSFSVVGLIVPGIVINDPGCTRKTFPDFFSRFEKLYS
jgi:3-phosphoshikimate 1-carboxyvinyltransferase